MNVLIVDDDPFARQAIGAAIDTLLTDAPREADGGTAAMQVLEQGYNPDLIITDVRMPDVDGMELLDLLRQDMRYAAIPVMMVTGSPEQDVVRKALQIGVQGFILKPVTRDAAPRVRAVLSRFHTTVLDGVGTCTQRHAISPAKYWQAVTSFVTQSRRLILQIQALPTLAFEQLADHMVALNKQRTLCQTLGTLLTTAPILVELKALGRLLALPAPPQDPRYTDVARALQLNLQWLQTYTALQGPTA